MKKKFKNEHSRFYFQFSQRNKNIVVFFEIDISQKKIHNENRFDF